MVAASPRDRAAGPVGDGDLARLDRLLICRQDDEPAIAVTEADRNPSRRILKPEDQSGEQPCCCSEAQQREMARTTSAGDVPGL